MARGQSPYMFVHEMCHLQHLLRVMYCHSDIAIRSEASDTATDCKTVSTRRHGHVPQSRSLTRISYTTVAKNSVRVDYKLATGCDRVSCVISIGAFLISSHCRHTSEMVELVELMYSIRSQSLYIDRSLQRRLAKLIYTTGHKSTVPGTPHGSSTIHSALMTQGRGRAE